MSTTMSDPVTAPGDKAVTHLRVAVIGAGFAGIAAAVPLQRQGITDFVVLERAGDVPSHLYSLSFAPNPDWARAFSRGEQIWQYVRQVAADHHLHPHRLTGAPQRAAA